jgi:hypothetical protein
VAKAELTTHQNFNAPAALTLRRLRQTPYDFALKSWLGVGVVLRFLNDDELAPRRLVAGVASLGQLSVGRSIFGVALVLDGEAQFVERVAARRYLPSLTK